MPNACLAAMLLDLSFCCPPLPGSTTLTPPVHQAHAGAAMQTRVSWMSGARGMRFWSQHCFNALASILPSTALPGSVRRTATAYQNNFFSIDGSKASRAFFFGKGHYFSQQHRSGNPLVSPCQNLQRRLNKLWSF